MAYCIRRNRVANSRAMIPLLIKELWSLRRQVIFVLTPICLTPLLVNSDDQVSKCAFIMILMGIYWAFEVIPVAITGLLPALLFPFIGILDINEVAVYYCKPVILMFVGGLIIACAVENCNLHKRIALRMILVLGASENRLMFGLMLPTWVLSMFTSNTATTAMMTPIALSILDQLHATESFQMENTHIRDQEIELTDLECNSNKTDVNTAPNSMENDLLAKCDQVNICDKKLSEYKRRKQRFVKAIILCIAYAANVGGTGSLIGTGPNMVLLGMSETLYQRIGQDNPISFASWFMLGLPVSFLCLIVIWIWMQIFFLRCSNIREKRSSVSTEIVKNVIRRELGNLGRISFAEIAVLIHFIALFLLWFFRRPVFMTGWGKYLPSKLDNDASTAVLVACLLFVIPNKIPRYFCCRKDVDEKKPKIEPLITWSVVHNRLPWMVFWLIGGGFALARGSEKSGLSEWIGKQLLALSGGENWVTLLTLSFIAAAATEVTSNTAIATIFLPILQEMALTLKVHPLYFMFPIAIATSFAFMLPVATPPNAIVYSTERVKLSDMISGGFMLNVLCICILNLGANTWGKAAFGFGTFPPEMLNLTLNTNYSKLTPSNSTI